MFKLVFLCLGNARDEGGVHPEMSRLPWQPTESNKKLADGGPTVKWSLALCLCTITDVNGGSCVSSMGE